MTVPRRLRTWLAAGLLSFANSPSAYPQQPAPDNPATNKPPGIILKSATSNSAEESSPPKIEHLSDLASRLLHYTGDAGCQKSNCKILVTNFILTTGDAGCQKGNCKIPATNFILRTGYASPYGIQAADELALEFARQDKTVQVIDRKLFKDKLNQLEEERIPIDILNSENVARWLGLKLGVTIVLVGTAKGIPNSNAVELSARFLNSLDVDKIGPSAEVNLTPSESLPDLTPIALPQLPPLPESFQGKRVYRGGVNGVGLPNCYLMPNPPYPEDARTFRFSGTAMVEGIVRSDGTVRPVRFIHGAPYGLDESILQTLNTWRCKPATLEGSPVSVLVPFEITFRLY
jgi:TonB family protein